MARVLALPCSSPPRNATHWTGRAVAKAVGVSLSDRTEHLDGHGLKPHLCRTFKMVQRPAFRRKARRRCRFVFEPAGARIGVQFDEKSQIQALDRTQPGLPIKKGRAGTMTHDYKRNGTTTLFAALNTLDGTVIGSHMKRHRHQEWLKFLKLIDQQTPAGKELHLIVDNYATHKHPKVKRWLAKHPRFHIHFTPTSASWLNMVERFFSVITRRKFAGACSDLSPNWRMLSAATSENTTVKPSHSSGRKQQRNLRKTLATACPQPVELSGIVPMMPIWLIMTHHCGLPPT